MPGEFKVGAKLSEMVGRMVASYHRDKRTQHLDQRVLPSRAEIVKITEMLLELVYPGYWGRQDLTSHNISYHVGEQLSRVGQMLYPQVFYCVCFDRDKSGRCTAPNRYCDDGSTCREDARELTLAYLDKLPDIRERLAGDVQAAYDGDPAAINTDEVILAYPGVLAVTVYRLAHELHVMGVPLMPRIMTEWAHSETGVDIHPGAKIGRNFFIDHATGVVIGETAEIGDNVKLYQGVTLGARSFPKDERGRVIRGHKRHPTVEDNVTIYANAIVLGGETVLGAGCEIGGSVFVTKTIPPDCTVTLKPPELRYRNRNGDSSDAKPAEAADAKPPA